MKKNFNPNRDQKINILQKEINRLKSYFVKNNFSKKVFDQFYSYFKQHNEFLSNTIDRWNDGPYI